MAPEAEPVIWARLPQGPSRTLDHETITRAAVALADREGLQAVSIRKVANEVGSSPMSLYRHINSRDDLTELMYDAVLGELDLDAIEQDWQAGLTRIARGLRTLHHRHPWVGQLAQRATLGPNAIRMLEHAMAVVQPLGLTIDATLDLVATTVQFTRGFVLEEVGEVEAQRRRGMDQQAWHRHLAPFLTRLLQDGEHPYLERLIRDAEDFPDLDVVFERRLAMLLDGLAISLGVATPQDQHRGEPSTSGLSQRGGV